MGDSGKPGQLLISSSDSQSPNQPLSPILKVIWKSYPAVQEAEDS